MNLTKGENGTFLISIIFETLFHITVHFRVSTKINYFRLILFVFIITSLIIELLITFHKLMVIYFLFLFLKI